MKRIKMLKDARGSEEGTGTVQDYKEGTEHTVSDQLAAAFKSMDACEVLADTAEEELLGTGKSEEKAEVKNKAETKDKAKNK